MRIVFYIIGIIGLMMIMSYGTLLFLLGMLPTFVASYVDHSHDRNNYRVVAACNFSGVLPFVMDLWKQGITSDSVTNMLMNPQVWLLMYGAAAFGWGVVWFFPKAMHMLLEMVQNSTIKSLEAKQQQIVDEWGIDVEKASRKALRNAAFQEEKRQKKKAAGEA